MSVISSTFDFVDAQPDLIEKRYLERFESLWIRLFKKPNNYYYQYAIGDRGEAIKMAKRSMEKCEFKEFTRVYLAYTQQSRYNSPLKQSTIQSMKYSCENIDCFIIHPYAVEKESSPFQ